MTTSVVGRPRRKSAAASDRPESEQEQPLMKVVTVKFEGSRSSFSLGAWFSCDEQIDRQEGL